MSKRRDFPIVFGPVPVAKVMADAKAILSQVRDAERRGKTPIKDQVSFLVDLIERYGWKLLGSSPTEYRRWHELAKLDTNYT